MIPYEKRTANPAAIQPFVSQHLSPNEWGVLEDESEELSCAELLEYEDEILALIEAYKSVRVTKQIESAARKGWEANW